LRTDIKPKDFIQGLVLHRKNGPDYIRRALETQEENDEHQKKVLEALAKWKKPPILMTEEEKLALERMVHLIEK